MRLVLLLAVLVTSLTGCSIFQKEISDYEQRSTVFAWVDVKDLAPNRLHAIHLYQHRPVTKEPYYGMGTVKMDGGYLIYTHITPNGAYKLDSLSGQQCMLIFCGNTVYTYNLGKQGDVGTVVIDQPGVYFLGAYKLSDVKTGWFQPGKFEIEQVEGPGIASMLTELLEESPEKYPVVAQRIQQALESQQ